jgi:hypothetical protein
VQTSRPTTRPVSLPVRILDGLATVGYALTRIGHGLAVCVGRALWHVPEPLRFPVRLFLCGLPVSVGLAMAGQGWHTRSLLTAAAGLAFAAFGPVRVHQWIDYLTDLGEPGRRPR